MSSLTFNIIFVIDKRVFFILFHFVIQPQICMFLQLEIFDEIFVISNIACECKVAHIPFVCQLMSSQQLYKLMLRFWI